MTFSRLTTILSNIIILLFYKLLYNKHLIVFCKKTWNVDIGCHFRMIQNTTRTGKLQLHITGPVKFHRGALIMGSGQIKCNRNISFGRNLTIECKNSIDIGQDTIIAENVSIRDTDHKFSDTAVPIRSQGCTVSPVRIGNDVWIGFGVVITKGVTIGDGCVIGANSVVTRDIPPYSVAVGVPARVIKKRGE